MTALYIILDATSAEAVRGATEAGHALAPIALALPGIFVLPVGVLDDPAHAQHHAFLGGLPVREVEDEEWPPPPPIF